MRARRKGWLSMVLGLLVFAAIAAWMFLGVRQTAEASGEEGRRLSGGQP